MADHPDDKRKDAGAPADDPTAGGDRTAVLPTSGGRTAVPPPGGDRTATLAPADKRTATFDAPAPANAPALASTPPPASAGDDITFVRSAGEDAGDDATIIRPRTRGRPRLIACDPAGGTREFPLTAPDVAIGRAATCGIVLANPEVSRLHARIVAQGEEHALIPVGARRNTYVNGEAATAERLLHHGDVIQLASERLVYCESEDIPAAAAGSPAASTGVPKAALAGAAAVAVALVLYFSSRSEPPAPPPAPVAVAPAVPARPQPPPAAPAQDGGAAAPAERGGAPGESAAVAPAVAPQAQRAAQLEKLLYQADIAFLEKKYTSPPEGSAVFAYREVLKLDPTNERARTRVATIVDQYLAWAEAALRERDRNRARLYADKAAYVHEQVPEAGSKEAIGRRLDALARALGTARAPAP